MCIYILCIYMCVCTWCVYINIHTVYTQNCTVESTVYIAYILCMYINSVNINMLHIYTACVLYIYIYVAGIFQTQHEAEIIDI